MSSTFKNLTEHFTVEYGDGTVAAGYLAQETVNIAGLNVTNQVFGYVTFQSILNFFNTLL